MPEIKYEADKKFENIPSLKDKCLRINLNEDIYGTFAEIGAGPRRQVSRREATDSNDSPSIQCLLKEEQ